MKKWLAAVMMFASVASCSAADMNDDDSINIYFARHGKTLLNTFDRVQGWADSPLTEDGIRVAQYLGEGLKGIKFDNYYSSDAGRQRETMAVILKQAGVHRYHLNEMKGLREAFFGGFEGGYNKDMATAGAHQLGLNGAAELFAKMKAGTLSVEQNQNALAAADPKRMTENYQQVKERTQAALHTIVENAKKNGEKNILAVSSGTAMQIMIADLTESTEKNKPLPNAAVVKIVYNHGEYSVPEIGSMQYVNNGKRALDKK